MYILDFLEYMSIEYKVLYHVFNTALPKVSHRALPKDLR